MPGGLVRCAWCISSEIRHHQLWVLIIMVTTQTFQILAHSSLKDCETAAAAFRSTCDTTATPPLYVRDIPAQEIFINNAPNSDETGQNRIGSFTCPITFNPLDSRKVGDSCSFQRRLCVTCSISASTGVTRIRVQSNGLPDHSYWMESTNIREQNIDFEVDFDTTIVNATMNFSNPRLEFSTTNDLNNALCQGTSTQDNKIPGHYNFVHMGDSSVTSTNSFSGISISGVPFGVALQKNLASNGNNMMQDSHHSINGLPVQIDTCLIHASQESEGAGALQYTTASPCLFGARAKQSYQKICSPKNSCGNITSEITKSYSTLTGASNKTIIGIAKDGHLIYGPTLSKAGGVDACNGIIFDGNKGDGVLRSYGYVATTTFPYLVGCFGPASYPVALPTCTLNPPSSYIPWKDLYLISKAADVVEPESTELLPPLITTVVNSAGESPHGSACSDLKSMVYKDGISIISSKVNIPYLNHQILFADEFETVPTILSISLEINPSGTALVNNILPSYFTIGVVSITKSSLIIRITTSGGFVADSNMFQVRYSAVASRLGACPIRGAIEQARTGQMRDYQHLSVEVNVPQVNLKSSLICETSTGVNVAKSATIKAGSIFQSYIESNPTLNLVSSNENHLPIISGNGFADSLVTVSSGQCSLEYLILQDGKGGHGGAIQVKTNAKITLDHVILRNNLSPAAGGGLFVSKYSTAIVKGSFFYNNKAIMMYVGQASGGAIHNRGNLTVSDSTFYSNIAGNIQSQASGGGLYNVGQANISFSNFLFNQANGNMVGEGGAIATFRINTALNVHVCSFINNSAAHSGGAVFAQGYVQLMDCIFDNSTAGSVGPTIRITPDAPEPSLNNISVHNDACEIEYAGSDGYAEFLKPDNFRDGPW